MKGKTYAVTQIDSAVSKYHRENEEKEITVGKKYKITNYRYSLEIISDSGSVWSPEDGNGLFQLSGKLQKTLGKYL